MVSLEIKQNIRTTQRLSLSADLKMSITILSLDREELASFVSEALERNPCLSEISRKENKIEENFQELAHTLKALPVSTHQYSKSLHENSEDGLSQKHREYVDNRAVLSLHTSIRDQLHLFHLSDDECDNAEIVSQYIDDNGFISIKPTEIQKLHNLEIEDILFAIKTIQKCEPTGVGAQSVQECLILQLRKNEKTPPLAITILENYWSDFEKQNLSLIAKKESVSIDKIKEAMNFIRLNVDPRPTRQFGDDVSQIVSPDVYVFKRDEKWICSLNENGLPRIRLSKKYAHLLDQLKDNANAQNNKDTIRFLSNNMKSAKWLLRSLLERNKTILRVTEVILRRQEQFFEKGVEYLTPMTLRDVALELGLHESTISRSTADKYMHSPRGIFELKYFFNTAIADQSGKELANESVKKWVLDIIKNENREHPHSDSEIADMIEADKGVKIARRTVSKYRELLGILSSSKRVKRF